MGMARKMIGPKIGSTAATPITNAFGRVRKTAISNPA